VFKPSARAAAASGRPGPPRGRPPRNATVSSSRSNPSAPPPGPPRLGPAHPDATTTLQ